MKKIILLSGVLLGMWSPVAAQNFNGKAIYESKTNADIDMEGRDIPEQEKKRIMDRMRQSLEKTFILDFNHTTSLYKEEERLEQPVGGRGPGIKVFADATGGGTYYKDIKEGVYYNQVEMFGKIFLIKDSLPELNWKLENETKKIGEYTCYKATTIKKVKRPDFHSAEQEADDKEEKARDTVKDGPVKEKTKEITITAWYAPDIPVNQGPGEYWGLPGLIMEINADRTAILCSKIVMNPKEKDKIEVPKKGKQVSRAEFDEIMEKKMEEIQEMHRGDRRGRDGKRVFRIGG